MIVKAQKFQEDSPNAACFNLSDIAAEARQIVDEARRQSRRIIADAQGQVEHIHRQARQTGHEQGHQQGLEEGKSTGHEQAFQQAQTEFQQQSAQLLDVLRSTLAQFDAGKQELLWRAEQETVVLAIAIAEKVIKQTGLDNRCVAAENVKAALELLAGNTNVSVSLNNKDIEHLQLLAGADDAVLGKYTNIDFRSDERIAPGGCCLTTAQGKIDAQLDTQIQRIAAELVMAGPADAPASDVSLTDNASADDSLTDGSLTDN